MTTEERVGSLMRYGYSERQARFLVLVVLHGGYFLRRQYAAFRGDISGSGTFKLLRAVLTRNHAIASRFHGRWQVYHVTAPALYAALGDPSHDHHRPHGLRGIRRRLMALDFVLSRPDWTFLATERDLTAFFLHEQRVPRDLLPGARQRRGPIAVAPDRSSIALAYLDDADDAETGFVRFLRRHAPLCQRLSIAVEIVFVTAVDGQLTLAERAFADALDPQESDILAYVQARQLLEQDSLHGLQQQELDAMRKQLRILEDRSRVRLLVHRVPFDYRPFGMWKGERC